MKKGAIDIGTNSSRMLGVEVKDGQYIELVRDRITTRLGEGVAGSGKITELAIERTLTAVLKFVQTLNNLGINEINIAGTSALRDVDNGSVLVNAVREKTGYDLKIISGLEEARLVHKGACLDISGNNFLIIDIGGGSTEFIWNDNKLNFISLDIGAVRLTEMFARDIRQGLTPGEAEKVRQYVNKIILDNLNIEQINQLKAVGVGGTITTLAAIDRRLSEYNIEKIHKYKLPYAIISDILKQLLAKNLEERKAIKGLQPERADIINAGVIILKEVMSLCKLKQIIVSEKDILYGLIITNKLKK